VPPTFEPSTSQIRVWSVPLRQLALSHGLAYRLECWGNCISHMDGGRGVRKEQGAISECPSRVISPESHLRNDSCWTRIHTDGYSSVTVTSASVTSVNVSTVKGAIQTQASKACRITDMEVENSYIQERVTLVSRCHQRLRLLKANIHIHALDANWRWASRCESLTPVIN
jgi:hypothetical protein